MPDYLRYSDDLETPEADETEVIRKIIDVHANGMHTVRAEHGGDAGHSVRISHAKAHGFAKGELVIDANLPPELAQGLFATPGRHAVIVRMATVPGELLDDRQVSPARGFSVKVMDVPGPKLPGHEGSTTQDFVFNTGKAFLTGTAKAFLAAFTFNAEVVPHLPDVTKGIASVASRATNAALNVFGLNAAKLDFYGHPKYHPLSEAYYSQVPLRYGDYVAKMSFTPANAELKELYELPLAIEDENGLRTATVAYFKTHAAVFDVNVQLAVDETTTPIENAAKEWPEDVTPYRRVAQLVLPPQNAFDPARQDFVDFNLSFSPAHSLAAHRPLGSIMRARLATYPVLAKMRREENGKPQVEPSSVGQIPG